MVQDLAGCAILQKHFNGTFYLRHDVLRVVVGVHAFDDPGTVGGWGKGDGGGAEFCFTGRGWGLEPERAKVCGPKKKPKTIFPFVNFIFSHYEIRVRGGGETPPNPPPPTVEMLSCQAKLGGGGGVREG